VTAERLKFWGWGYESQALRPEEVKALADTYAKRFGLSAFQVIPNPRAEEISLRAPRVAVPGNLSPICSTDHFERLLHSYGKSFFDSARAFARDFRNPPDVVALPRSESDIVDILDWADSVDAVVIPWGGGSSVV
jgi:alkyldihydroxyacetonephosphate synthase